MKKLLLIVTALSLPVFVLAADVEVKGERSEVIKTVHSTPAPVSVESILEEVALEAVQTVLQPEFQQLEDRFQKQISEVRAQIALATDEQAELLEQQIIALKAEQEEARLVAVLNYVRAQGNHEAEARVLAAIESRNNQTPVQRVTVERDPLTGDVREGGAK
ncbi:hypothetical protein KJZ99_05725 [bacterium]|nr:hypothetical protein [bacterium]